MFLLTGNGDGPSPPRLIRMCQNEASNFPQLCVSTRISPCRFDCMLQSGGCIYCSPYDFSTAQDRFLSMLHCGIFLLDVDFLLQIFSTLISLLRFCALLLLPRKESSKMSTSQHYSSRKREKKNRYRAARGCSSPLHHLCGLL